MNARARRKWQNEIREKYPHHVILAMPLRGFRPAAELERAQFLRPIAGKFYVYGDGKDVDSFLYYCFAEAGDAHYLSREIHGPPDTN